MAPQSNFIPADHSFHAAIAETLATLFISADFSIYSQNFSGKLNVIYDSLSRDHHINNANLTFLIQHSFPQQAPQNLKICALLPIITSWVNSHLLEMPEKVPEHQAQIQSLTGRGYSGSISSPASTYNTTNSSTNSNKKTESDSSAPSPNPSEKREFSRSGEKDLARDTCQEAVEKVAEVFRANLWPDPRHDLSRNIDDNL